MEGVFAVNKPSGISSRLCLDKVNRILSKSQCFKETLKEMERKRNAGRIRKRKFHLKKLKMGHGGTLDPIASGVLIFGIGSGTKKLSGYMNGSVKVYDAEALFGGLTTTGDADGQLIFLTENSFITKQMIEDTRDKFVGTLSQTPPIFSALKMDGKPLYKYAREGLPLPRSIKPREVHIYDLQLQDDCLSTKHNYHFLKSDVCEDGSLLVDQLKNNPTLNSHDVSFSKEYMEKASKDDALPKVAAEPRILQDDKLYEADDYRAPLLHFIAKVSSGTYIRSLISDFARTMGSSAYMVKLTRECQNDWVLGQNTFELSDFEDNDESVWGPVLKKVFEQGPEINIRQEIELAKKTASKGKIEEPVQTDPSEIEVVKRPGHDNI